MEKNQFSFFDYFLVRNNIENCDVENNATNQIGNEKNCPGLHDTLRACLRHTKNSEKPK